MGLAKEIDTLLAQRGSPMRGLGRAFVQAGRRYGVDPKLLVAIAGHESEYGTKGYAVGTNNPFGWGVNDGTRFDTWKQSIDTVARGLKIGYLDKGLRTIGAIGAIYAPVGADNDPTALNEGWSQGVAAIYRQLEGRSPSRKPLPAVQPAAAPSGSSTVSYLLEIASGAKPTEALTGLAAEHRAARVDAPRTTQEPRRDAAAYNPGSLLGGKWTMGGGPDAHGARPLGNWQSDRAWDMMAPTGTPVYAPADSTVTKASWSDNGKTVWGFQVTLKGGGDSFFLTHLGQLAKGVAAGQKIKKGQLIGWLGDPPYFASHLHIGIEHGDLGDYGG